MIFLSKIKTFGKQHTFTHAHVLAGKEFAWFQRAEKLNYHFYSVLDHWTNDQCCPTRNTSNDCFVSSLLAHRADHYGIMVAWWDFSPSLGYLTALLSHPVWLGFIWCFQWKYIVLQGFWKGSVNNVAREQLKAIHGG